MRLGVLRYYHTLRHLKPIQVFGRLVPMARRWADARGWNATRLPKVPAPLQGGLANAVPFLHHEPWNTREGLLAGRFNFLNHTVELGRPVDWMPERETTLWRYNLHYFEYLHRLRPAEQEALCYEWVAANPPGQTMGWWPYPTSRRIVNWCKAGPLAPAVLESLYRQAAFLYRNMEVYFPGNHWLENARALIMAGCFFEGQGEAEAWLQEGLRVFRQETPIQVLPDGGYFERSPMYHALMLEAYLDLVNVLPRAHPDRAWLAEATLQMAACHAATIHPDGDIALFNDAAFEIAPPPAALANYTEALIGPPPSPPEALPDTGYFFCRRPGFYLIIDGGPVGPDYLPAHAHADIFSFELSLGGVRWIVDSGTYDYQPGPLRDALRGTAAHNTLQIDGVDQVECWKSHRVGRRAEPSQCQARWEDDRWRFSGRFDGYRLRLGDGLRHERAVSAMPAQGQLRVVDHVQGTGRHRLTTSLHFHPSVTVAVDGAEAVATRVGRQVLLHAEQGTWVRDEAWYCPAFGVKVLHQVLRLSCEADLPATLSYTVDGSKAILGSP